MSNPLKKTMVYLGLADEELEHEAPQAPAPAAPVVHAAPAQKSGSGRHAAPEEPCTTEHTAGGDERDPHRAPASVP